MQSFCDVRWTLFYVGGVLGCDAPILEALDHCAPWQPLYRPHTPEQMIALKVNFLGAAASIQHNEDVFYEIAGPFSIRSYATLCPVYRFSRHNVVQPCIEVVATQTAGWQCAVVVFDKDHKMTLHLWLREHNYKAQLQKAAVEFGQLEEGRVSRFLRKVFS